MTISSNDPLLPEGQVRPGDVLAGKYRVDRLIGVGGMGVVVQATHLELETQVAIKFLLPEAQTNAELVARFAREARAAVQIKSEHVARTFDVGRLENDCPYIVMEYLEGTDLSRRIAEKGPLPIPEAVRFILHACDALSEAHALGIVHRDLKPANLFLARRRDGIELGKILDFGISKLTQATSTGPGMAMTRTSTLMGSPVYMSPEQLVAAKNVDPRADIWALGVTLYEALCGVTPFVGDTLPELCTRIMTQPPEPILMHRADVPEPLANAVMRCLEKEPSQRFANIAEFAEAIRPFAPISTTASFDRGSNAMIAAPTGDRGVHAAQALSVQKSGARTMNAWGNTNHENEAHALVPRRRTGLWVALGALISLALSGTAAVLWFKHDSPHANADLPQLGTSTGVETTTQSTAAANDAIQASAAPSTTVSPQFVVSPHASLAPAARADSPSVSTAPAVAAKPAARPQAVPQAKGPSPAKPPQTNAGAPKAASKDLFGDRN